MLWIRVQEIGPALHPSEVIVGVTTAEGGQENLVVDKRSIRNGAIGVGYPVGRENNRLLIELPRETLRGHWRVWVSEALVQETAA